MKNKLLLNRQKIDIIDKKIVKLLNSRAKIALEIGKIKKETSSKIVVPKREQEVLKNILNNNYIIDENDLKVIYKKIMLACKRLEK